MGHGGGESVAVVDPSSIESQGHHASLPPGHGSWIFHQTDGGPVENGASLSSICYYDQQKETSVSADAQGGMSTAFDATTSGLSEANAAQGYAGYDPYGDSMYYGYQLPTSDSSSQQVGASQNPGAPYQPPSSFPNTGSYVGPASYSATYYNAGDH